MWFLSETMKLEANWLFLDHEVVSDTMLIDYLNPTGTNLVYKGSAPPILFGLTTVLILTGVPFFKSAGYNCSAKHTSILMGVQVWTVQSVKGNNLPASPDESYGLSLTKDYNPIILDVTSVRVSVLRYQSEADLNIFNMDKLREVR